MMSAAMQIPMSKQYKDILYEVKDGVVRVTGGSIEVMKHIIGRHMFAALRPAKSLQEAA